jgi:hypothetical protein
MWCASDVTEKIARYAEIQAAAPIGGFEGEKGTSLFNDNLQI